MKVVHLCLACFFPSGFSYQENLLPKYHQKMGYKVEVIASTLGFDKNGKLNHLIEKCGLSYNEYNIKVTRIPYKIKNFIGFKLNIFNGLKNALNNSAPDILFIHGCQFVDICVVKQYLKTHPKVIVYVDNHADFSNSARSWFSKNIMHRLLWKFIAHRINPFVRKWYGVLPTRVDFLKSVYKLPSDKIEFLPMGADDDFVEKYISPNVRNEYRKKYGVAEDDFLIVTGGKIDPAKKQTLALMDAVNQINSSRLKLIVFGSVVPELRNLLNKKISKRVQYIGWLTSEQSYPHFAMADLVVFPGRHSVFWEQVAGMGIPMIVKYWEGTTHVNRGGNVKFLYKDSVEEIEKVVKNVFFSDELKKMKTAALNNKTFFSYREIAGRSIK